MVPEGMTVRIIDAIAEEMSAEEFFEEIRQESTRYYVSYVTGTTFQRDALGIQWSGRQYPAYVS